MCDLLFPLIQLMSSDPTGYLDAIHVLARYFNTNLVRKFQPKQWEKTQEK